MFVVVRSPPTISPATVLRTPLFAPAHGQPTRVQGRSTKFHCNQYPNYPPLLALFLWNTLMHITPVFPCAFFPSECNTVFLQTSENETLMWVVWSKFVKLRFYHWTQSADFGCIQNLAEDKELRVKFTASGACKFLNLIVHLRLNFDFPCISKIIFTTVYKKNCK